MDTDVIIADYSSQGPSTSSRLHLATLNKIDVHGSLGCYYPVQPVGESKDTARVKPLPVCVIEEDCLLTAATVQRGFLGFNLLANKALSMHARALAYSDFYSNYARSKTDDITVYRKIRAGTKSDKASFSREESEKDFEPADIRVIVQIQTVWPRSEFRRIAGGELIFQKG